MTLLVVWGMLGLLAGSAQYALQISDSQAPSSTMSVGWKISPQLKAPGVVSIWSITLWLSES